MKWSTQRKRAHKRLFDISGIARIVGYIAMGVCILYGCGNLLTAWTVGSWTTAGKVEKDGYTVLHLKLATNACAITGEYRHDKQTIRISAIRPESLRVTDDSGRTVFVQWKISERYVNPQRLSADDASGLKAEVKTLLEQATGEKLNANDRHFRIAYAILSNGEELTVGGFAVSNQGTVVIGQSQGFAGAFQPFFTARTDAGFAIRGWVSRGISFIGFGLMFLIASGWISVYRKRRLVKAEEKGDER